MKRAVLTLLIALPAPAAAGYSASFTNNRSGMAAGGGEESSASFSLTASIGQFAQQRSTSTSFSNKPGLIPNYFYPAKPDLRVASCVPGEIELEWPAPGNDGDRIGTKAKQYEIVLATSADFGNPLATPALPAPAVARSTQSYSLTGLDVNTTYYFTFFAREADQSAGPNKVITSTEVTGGIEFEASAAVTGFRVGDVMWSVNFDNAVTACQVDHFELARSTGEVGPWIAVTTTTAFQHTDSGVSVGGTYYFQIEAVNPFGNTIATANTELVWIRTKPPMPPSRFVIVSSGTGVEIAWGNPNEFNFGLGFTDPSHLNIDELSAYQVFRTTDLFSQAWDLVSIVSTDTRRYFDANPPEGAMYRIIAKNETEVSEDSMVLDQDGNGYIVTKGERTHVYVPAAKLEGLWPNDGKTYRIKAQTTEVENADENGVLSSVRFDVFRSTESLGNEWQFPESVEVRVGASLPGSGGAGSAVKNAAPLDLAETAVYWHNGEKYVKLYGVPNYGGQYLEAETSFLGAFQLRSLSRGTEFHFDKNELSNRFITPNGDGVNDYAVFRFDNPADSQISGKIFNTRGALITTFTQTSRTTAAWDGKAQGAAVNPGVYIYQLEGDGKTVTGTVVVVR